MADFTNVVRALPARARDWFRARTPRFRLGAATAALAVVTLALPSPYVVEQPGPTADVLGESGGAAVITISGGRTYRDEGKLLLTTVNAAGMPGYVVTNAEVLVGWLRSDSIVLPREAVVPAGQSADEYKRETESQMTGSQDAASSQALAFLRARGVDVDGVQVSMHVDDIGGPSAGMMYTLGVIDELTPESETGGQTIAGTGTINEDGTIGKIGGIRLKMLGAKRDGATWFLAPADNCSEVAGHVPEGLRDVRVSTLEEAYDALTAIGRGEADALPHCTAQ
ncbi:lon protease [Bifidobacterium sp. DSM 109958]|uniref:endopeptidase La n=1 Tax=Bifidobacterium moraviense TaxID=2675323 RepID=A0A7Y0F174_9BIFI|nr:S16 family serine protease [Bifidobacterium sp. DSM 109958]NMN00136.1 lon protease [Bifidobacterium sp. DSM 109958]